MQNYLSYDEKQELLIAQKETTVGNCYLSRQRSYYSTIVWQPLGGALDLLARPKGLPLVLVLVSMQKVSWFCHLGVALLTLIV